ncbi:MAG: hypothetical protein QG626_667 [Patescibacteria group bacterium]|nr:hypothetical protein [Patescibacteria group bacterium]
MTNPVITVLFWTSIVTFLAIFEIETGGRYDWTERDPTWSRLFPVVHQLHTLLRIGIGTIAHLLQILAFHVQFLLGATWTPTTELVALATYFIVLPLYDMSWFVLRPRTERYMEIDTWKRSKAPSLRGIPLNLLFSIPIASLLAWIAGRLARNDQIVSDFAVTLLGFVAFLMFISLAAPMYRAWHNHVAQVTVTETPATSLRPQQPPTLRIPERKPHAGFGSKMVIVVGMSCATNGALLACAEQSPGQQPWLSGNPIAYLVVGISVVAAAMAYDRNWKKQLI